MSASQPIDPQEEPDLGDLVDNWTIQLRPKTGRWSQSLPLLLSFFFNLSFWKPP